MYAEGEMTRNLTLSIQGMHCGGCVNRVANALKKLEGLTVHDVQVGSARVEYDESKVSTEAIAEAVNKLGFTASQS
jgi:copper chaperone